MRGIFFVQLQSYVCNNFERKTWEKILVQAGLSDSKIYYSHQQYPEEEFFQVLAEALRITKTSLDKFLVDLGEKLVPFFVQTYNSVIQKDWKTLDVIERLELFNYNILQQGENALNQGKFICKRENHSVNVTYISPRKMCYFAIGLMKGFAKHFNEKIIIKHNQCALENAPECHILVSLVQ